LKQSVLYKALNKKGDLVQVTRNFQAGVWG